MTLAVRVTVVIPCRNDAGFLDACLTALAAQTRPADRVVVVDNASTDASAAVARRHGADIVSESRIGIWPAAARGYDEARHDADIIATLRSELQRGPAGHRLADLVWEQAGFLRVRREEPLPTVRGKLFPFQVARTATPR